MCVVQGRCVLCRVCVSQGWVGGCCAGYVSVRFVCVCVVHGRYYSEVGLCVFCRVGVSQGWVGGCCAG